MYGLLPKRLLNGNEFLAPHRILPDESTAPQFIIALQKDLVTDHSRIVLLGAHGAGVSNTAALGSPRLARIWASNPPIEWPIITGGTESPRF